MKQLRLYLLPILLIGSADILYGQLQHVYQDDQFMLSRLYAGLSSTSSFPIDSVVGNATADFRIGAMTRFLMTSQLSVKFWGVIHFEKNNNVAGYNSFSVLYEPVKKISLEAGLMATPTTILRPNPTTWQSQVETSTQQTIIPGRPGAKIGYRLTSDLKLTYGLFNHGHVWGHHVRLQIRNWHLAGYGSDQGMDFLAVKYVGNKFESTATYVLKKSVNAMMILKPVERWSLLADAGYDLNLRHSRFRQLAIRRHFHASKVHLQSFISLAYDCEARAVLGQVFLYLY